MEIEILSHNACALLQLPIEEWLNFVINGIGEQVDGDEIGGTVILFEQVAIDDARVFVQTELEDFGRALLAEVLIEFDADSVGVEFLRCDDHNAPIAGAEIVHLLTGLQAAELEHFIDDGLWGWVVWREFFGVAGLGPQDKATDGKKQTDFPHDFPQSYLKAQYKGPAIFSTQMWKILWKLPRRHVLQRAEFTPLSHLAQEYSKADQRR